MNTCCPPGNRLPHSLEKGPVGQHSDKFGSKISWPSGGEYKQFQAQDLLPSVQATIAAYRRLTF